MGKPFIKMVNYTHLMPTRYALEVELKSIVTTDLVSGSSANPTARQNARKEVKKIFEDKYNSSLKTGKNKWFFQKLRCLAALASPTRWTRRLLAQGGHPWLCCPAACTRAHP